MCARNHSDYQALSLHLILHKISVVQFITPVLQRKKADGVMCVMGRYISISG